MTEAATAERKTWNDGLPDFYRSLSPEAALRKLEALAEGDPDRRDYYVSRMADILERSGVDWKDVQPPPASSRPTRTFRDDAPAESTNQPLPMETPEQSSLRERRNKAALLVSKMNAGGMSPGVRTALERVSQERIAQRKAESEAYAKKIESQKGLERYDRSRLEELEQRKQERIDRARAEGRTAWMPGHGEQVDEGQGFDTENRMREYLESKVPPEPKIIDRPGMMEMGAEQVKAGLMRFFGLPDTVVKNLFGDPNESRTRTMKWDDKPEALPREVYWKSEKGGEPQFKGYEDRATGAPFRGAESPYETPDEEAGRRVDEWNDKRGLIEKAFAPRYQANLPRPESVGEAASQIFGKVLGDLPLFITANAVAPGSGFTKSFLAMTTAGVAQGQDPKGAAIGAAVFGGTGAIAQQAAKYVSPMKALLIHAGTSTATAGILTKAEGGSDEDAMNAMAAQIAMLGVTYGPKVAKQVTAKLKEEGFYIENAQDAIRWTSKFIDKTLTAGQAEKVRGGLMNFKAGERGSAKLPINPGGGEARGEQNPPAQQAPASPAGPLEGIAATGGSPTPTPKTPGQISKASDLIKYAAGFKEGKWIGQRQGIEQGRAELAPSLTAFAKKALRLEGSTDAQAQKIIDAVRGVLPEEHVQAIQKVAEAVDTVVAKGEFAKAAQKIDFRKMRPEDYAKAKEILGRTPTRTPKLETAEKASEFLMNALDNQKETVPPVLVEKSRAVLKEFWAAKKLGKPTADQWRAAAKELERLTFLSEKATKINIAGQDVERDKAALAADLAIARAHPKTNAPFVREGLRAREGQSESGRVANKTFDALETINEKLVNVGNKLNRTFFSGYHKLPGRLAMMLGVDHPLVKKLNADLMHGEDATAALITKSSKPIYDYLKKEGLTDAQWAKDWREGPYTLITQGGQRHNTNKATLITMELAGRDPHSRNALLQKGSGGARWGNHAEAQRLTPDQWADLWRSMPEDVKRAADAFQSAFRVSGAEANNWHIKEYLTPMFEDKGEAYAPVMREQGKNTGPTYSGSYIHNSWMKERTGGTKPLVFIPVDELFARHVSGVAAAVTRDKTATSIKSLFADPRVLKRMRTNVRYGEREVNEIIDLTNDWLAAGGAENQESGAWLVKAAKGNLTRAALGYRYHRGLIQLPAALLELGGKDGLRMDDIAYGAMKAASSATGRDTSMREAIEARSETMRQRMSGKHTINIMTPEAAGPKSGNDPAFWGILTGDTAEHIIVGEAYRHKGLRDGMAPKQALEYGAEQARRHNFEYQPPSHHSVASPIEIDARTKVFSALRMPFQSPIIAQAQKAMTALRAYSDAGPGEYKGTARNMLMKELFRLTATTTGVAGIGIGFYEAGAYLRHVRGQPDEEDRKDAYWKILSREYAGAVPGAGPVIDAGTNVIRAAQGEQPRNRGGTIIDRALVDANNAARSTQKMFEEWTKEEEGYKEAEREVRFQNFAQRAIKSSLSIVGYLSGQPSQLVNDIIETAHPQKMEKDKLFERGAEKAMAGDNVDAVLAELHKRKVPLENILKSLKTRMKNAGVKEDKQTKLIDLFTKKYNAMGEVEGKPTRSTGKPRLPTPPTPKLPRHP